MFIVWCETIVKWVEHFATEAEAHADCVKSTSREDHNPAWVAEHGDHDPHIIFEAQSFDALGTNKYTRPVAIYVRGVRWNCVKADD